MVEVLSVGGWLTHGDLVLDTEVDFLAVVEHRLIPAGVRSEWARVRGKGLATVWAHASQDTSRVGHAGVGSLVLGVLQQLRNLSVFLIVVVLIWCMLPLGRGGFLHLVVLHGYQGADRDVEKLLTNCWMLLLGS